MSPELLTPVSEAGQKQVALRPRVGSEWSWESFQSPSSGQLLRPSQRGWRTPVTISNLLLLKVTNLASVSSIESRLIHTCLKHGSSFNPQNNLKRLNTTLGKSLTLCELQFPQVQTVVNNSPAPVLATELGGFHVHYLLTTDLLLD